MAAIFPAAVPTQAQMWTAVNGVATELTADIDNAVTTVNVVDTTNFPSTGYFVVDSEVIKYTGKTGTAFTGCTRGADNTTAAVHSNGANANAYAVADHHNKVTEEITAIATLLGSNSQDIDLSARPGFGVKFATADGAHVWAFRCTDDGALVGTQLS